MRRGLQPLERSLTKALLFTSCCMSLACFALFASSTHWVRTDGQVVLVLSVLVLGMLGGAFAFFAFLMLLMGVSKR